MWKTTCVLFFLACIQTSYLRRQSILRDKNTQPISQCFAPPDYKIKDKISLDDMKGMWYLESNIKVNGFTDEEKPECTNMNLQHRNDESLSGVLTWKFQESNQHFNAAFVLLADENRSGKMVQLFQSPVSGPLPFWILDVDYSKYMVVVSCYTHGGNAVFNGFLLTRVQDIHSKKNMDTVGKEIDEAFAKINFPQTSPFLSHPQHSCSRQN